MIFLGTASNYQGKITHHLFTKGTKKDSDSLKGYLAGIFKSDPDKTYLTSNGRSALCLAIKSLVPENSEIILNGFTCRAVLVAIREANCTPVFADIEERNLNYTPETLEKLLSTHSNVKAIILQNTLGNTVNIEQFEKIAKKHNLKIIEDLAHCVGQKYLNNQPVGTIGDAVALSFGKGKVIDTITGGALILRSKHNLSTKPPKKHPKFASNFRARLYPLFGKNIRALYRIHLNKYLTGFLLKIHFIERSADAPIDLSHRLAHWQAKLALEQLKNLSTNPQKIRTFEFVKDREKLLKELKKNGYIFDEIWYDVPISPQRYYKNSGFNEKDCPIATKVAKQIINLPGWVAEKELKKAKKIIEEYKI